MQETYLIKIDQIASPKSNGYISGTIISTLRGTNKSHKIEFEYNINNRSLKVDGDKKSIKPSEAKDTFKTNYDIVPYILLSEYLTGTNFIFDCSNKAESGFARNSLSKFEDFRPNNIQYFKYVDVK